MQCTYFYCSNIYLRKNIKIIFNYLLGPVLFIILSYSLYKQIAHQPDLPERWAHIKQSWYNPVFWFVLFLMIVNYGIEARKWQLLLKPLEKFSLIKAFKSVLAGCSITMLTPNRIGEYGGRILFVQEPNRLRAISLTILGSISQLLVTILMGTLGLIVLTFFSEKDAAVFSFFPPLFSNTLLFLCIVLSILFLMFYLRIGWLIHLMQKQKFLAKPLKYVRLLDQFSGKQLLRILFLSLLRYMAFILQYMLLLSVMEVGISLLLSFWLLTIFYLVMVMAPSIGFTELPLRATATVEIFKLYSSNILGIQAAALGIWLINLVLPAIIGSILILGIKITKENDENP
ncbi:MAG: flippase-like domain-containing protein [Gloeobacteraceae cyanobacterium ES-bin-316]|nr:flippase-like domain-containing protein [Ferruginibacter sp.]